MNLEKIMAVGGLSGLHRMIANRSNGLIIEDLETGKRRFASSRTHQFTPLASIAIYTDDGESTELQNVFRNMRDQHTDHPPVSANADPEALHNYFADILPNYDRDRVHTGDIRKVIRWFTFLNDRNLLVDDDTQEEE